MATKSKLKDLFETICDMLDNDCIDEAMKLINALTKKQKLKFFKHIRRDLWD